MELLKSGGKEAEIELFERDLILEIRGSKLQRLESSTGFVGVDRGRGCVFWDFSVLGGFVSYTGLFWV